MSAPCRSKTAIDLLILALAYLTGYGCLLIYTDFLPYVFDNNESFSAFIHGSNLYHFGLEKSYGLTDEAYGSDPAAHPYVYTHQGNFPRLASLAMYALGLRSVEAQIAASTFSIGLTTIALIYIFFSRAGGRFLGTAAAVLFMTDYILSAQWLVNSFKAWHGFLLFLMLVLVQAYSARRAGKYLVGLGAASLCTGYFDLLMAVFTFVLCLVFATTVLWRDRRALLAAVGSMALGGILSASLLVAQLIGYYGTEGLKQDIYLTFVGRNYAMSDAQALKEWQEFFVSHRIVFWETLVDSKSFANLRSAFTSVFQFGFAVLTPYLGFLIACLAGAWSIAKCFRGVPGPRISDRLARASVILIPAWLFGGTQACGIAAPLAAAALLPPQWRESRWIARLNWFSLWYALSTVGLLICLTDALEGVALNWQFSFPVAGWAIFVLAIAPAAVFAWLCWPWRPNGVSVDAAGALAAGLAGLLLGVKDLYRVDNIDWPVLWGFVLDPWMSFGATRLFAMLAVMVAVGSLLQSETTRTVDASRKDGQITAYCLAIAAGFTAAYFFSPGYMVLINLQRYAPPLVFLVLPLAAIAAMEWSRQLQDAPRLEGTVRSAHLAALMLLGIHGVLLWTSMQVTYFRLVPPDGAVPYKLLNTAPYVGRSFVVNSYSAPAAAMTQTWAYIDQQFLNSGDYVLAAEGYKPASQEIYKWFADRDNPKYRFPDFALCVSPNNFKQAVLAVRLVQQNRRSLKSPEDAYRVDRRTARTAGSPILGCGGTLLIARLDDPQSGRPRVRILDEDRGILNRWLIAKLEADMPPFIEKISPESTERIAVNVTRSGTRCEMRTSYRYRQQQGKMESGSMMRAWVREVGSPSAETEKVLYAGAPVELLRIDPTIPGTIYVSITPATATRVGETFTSLPINPRDCHK